MSYKDTVALVQSFHRKKEHGKLFTGYKENIPLMAKLHGPNSIHIGAELGFSDYQNIAIKTAHTTSDPAKYLVVKVGLDGVPDIIPTTNKDDLALAYGALAEIPGKNPNGSPVVFIAMFRKGEGAPNDLIDTGYFQPQTPDLPSQPIKAPKSQPTSYLDAPTAPSSYPTKPSSNGSAGLGIAVAAAVGLGALAVSKGKKH